MVLPIYYWKRSLKITAALSIFTKIFRKLPNHFINEMEINKIESNTVEVENINFNLKQLLIDIQNSLKEIATKTTIALY
jgi:hypothetical protein